MIREIQVSVPDIGDFKDVEVTEVLVKPGDSIRAEQSLITVESDKASMEIPSPQSGRVVALSVKLGDKVSQGSIILALAVEDQAAAIAGSSVAPPPQTVPRPSSSPVATRDTDMQVDVLVLGSGPGGYTAAFRSADLGKKTLLVERFAELGGVCTNVGCIPSKALLHVARVVEETRELAQAGALFGQPRIDLEKLRAWKTDVAGKGAKGIAGLARQRKVQVVQGLGTFLAPNVMRVETPDGKTLRVGFEYCVIAVGSSVARLPGFPYDDPRIMDSTGALALADIPQRLLVVGGGIIGLEMATVYHALGSRLTIVEFQDGLMPGADRDLVRPLERRLQKQYEAILLKTKVANVATSGQSLRVSFEGASAGSGTAESAEFDRVLVATGRRPNGRSIGAEAAGVMVDERGFIRVDRQQRTNVPHIFAVGDVVGEPMLAHKATHEAKVAAEAIAGHRVLFDAMTIPSVAYTDPEVAWMGLTEAVAARDGIPYEKAVFPWAASGRARAIGRTEGSTKILFDPVSKKLLGAGIVGPNAGDLIAELVLAMEMGADLHDVSLSIHPHPTLSETVAFASEVGLGTVTDLLVARKVAAG